MDRRQYLTCLGSSGVIAITAGCLGGGSDVPPATDRIGDRALARSAGQLNRAALALEESGGFENLEEGAFDATESRTHLADAREFLRPLKLNWMPIAKTMSQHY